VLGVRIASTLALTSVAATLLLSGCGSDQAPDAAAPAPSSAGSSAHPSGAPSPSASAPTAAPSSAASPAAPAARPSGRGHKVDRFQLSRRPRTSAEAGAHLLAAARMPAVAGAPWTQTDPADAPAIGACQKTGLEPIGAMEEVRRSFTAPGGLTATQVVARFPDARSAWRAHGVLVAWHDDCEKRVSGAAVGPLEPVVVPVGNSDGYRASYPSRSRTAGLAILRTGTWLTLFEVSSPSAYPRHWDPARVALRRASRTF
jgi:hypothetical protein